MTCHHGFVRKKSQAPRLTQRKTRKLAVQTSTKEVGATNNDERRRYSPMTAFPEFAIPADVGQERVKHHLRRRDFAVEKERASSHYEEAGRHGLKRAPGTRWTK
jgi:hypothetical protein